MKLHPYIKMDTISMNSENSKTSKPHVLTLKVTNKLEGYWKGYCFIKS